MANSLEETQTIVDGAVLPVIMIISKRQLTEKQNKECKKWHKGVYTLTYLPFFK